MLIMQQAYTLIHKKCVPQYHKMQIDEEEEEEEEEEKVTMRVSDKDRVCKHFPLNYQMLEIVKKYIAI